MEAWLKSSQWSEGSTKNLHGAINGILASFCSGPENLSEIDFLVIINYNLKLQAKIKSFSLRLLSVRVLMTAT